MATKNFRRGKYGIIRGSLGVVRREEALRMLEGLIAQGKEFPDACVKAAHAHGVDACRLRELYDEKQQEGGAA